MKFRRRLKRWLIRRRVLAALAYAAAAHPGQRLGQIISNATNHGAPVFYIEDAELAAALERYGLRDYGLAQLDQSGTL